MPEDKVKHEFICRDCELSDPCILYFYVEIGEDSPSIKHCPVSGSEKPWKRLNRKTTQRTTEGG